MRENPVGRRWIVPFLLVLTGLASMSVRPGEPERSVPPAQDEEAALQRVRFFKDVQGTGFPGPHHILSRLTYNGDYVLLVETDAERRPISDTLLVWVQHHGPARPLSKQADWADLIISCYPELLTETTRQRHVLADASGKIWLYFVDDDYLIVADRRQPALDFALKRL
jgi:hypothetical protein